MKTNYPLLIVYYTITFAVALFFLFDTGFLVGCQGIWLAAHRYPGNHSLLFMSVVTTVASIYMFFMVFYSTYVLKEVILKDIFSLHSQNND